MNSSMYFSVRIGIRNERLPNSKLANVSVLTNFSMWKTVGTRNKKRTRDKEWLYAYQHLSHWEFRVKFLGWYVGYQAFEYSLASGNLDISRKINIHFVFQRHLIFLWKKPASVVTKTEPEKRKFILFVNKFNTWLLELKQVTTPWQ